MNMYQVVRTADKMVLAEGFAKREDAKVYRNKYNTGPIPTPKRDQPFCFVGRGSDHPRGPSNGHVNQSKRWV